MKNDTETKEQADAVIDSDIHVYPSDASPLKPFIPENLQLALKLAMDTQPWNGYQNPHGVNRRDVECLDAGDLARLHLDLLGIAYGVLQPQPGMYVGLIHNSDVANQLSTAWNDWQHEYYLSRDSRLLGSVCINIGDPEAAAQEITRAAGNFRFVQVVVPGESHLLYGHRFYDPIFSACEENNLVFALHPGQEGALGSSTPVGRPSSYFEWHSTLSITYQAQLASMISEGLFERYPRLRVLLVEGGFAWMPHLLWRMDRNFKSLRPTRPRLRRLPSEYASDHVWFTSQPMEEPSDKKHLLEIFDMVNAENRLCFSSDFPHWDFDDPQRVFPSQISPAIRRRILSENALELYSNRLSLSR
ncbi:MAG: amidohydrolase family protein [Verrucomicrobia bacterium]|nr:amidohydrolase family protein [Verrucomicrobiota bacterium]MDA1068971.1 amidohydrolase family protein [Verrucomicrobiota bacterium]